MSRAPSARNCLGRLGLGIALTLVASMQLWHYLFIANAGLYDAGQPRQPYDHRTMT